MPTPCKESGACASCCKVSAYCFAALLGWFALWAFLKLPYVGFDPMTNISYDEEACSDPNISPEMRKRCHGPEMDAALLSWNDDYRSPKLRVDYIVFVGLHVAMGVVLEGLFITLLLRGFAYAPSLSKVIAPLAFVFAVHIAPVADAFPSQSVNLFLCLLLWLCAIGIGLAHCCETQPLGCTFRGREGPMGERAQMALYVCLLIIGVVVNFGPLGELGLLATYSEDKASDRPDPNSGHGPYARCGCPGLGTALTWLVLLLGALYGLYGLACLYARSSAERRESVAELAKKLGVLSLVPPAPSGDGKQPPMPTSTQDVTVQA
jgi:hypothetical protein